MKKIILNVFVAPFVAVLLASCGGEGSSQNTSSSNDVSYPSGPNLGGYAATTKSECGLITSTACLQNYYESLFCQLDQGGVWTSSECQGNVAYIASLEETDHFDLNKKPIQNNGLGITGFDFVPVNYSTTVALPTGPQTFQVSGGLAMPVGIDKSKVKGVVTYFHGTQLDNQDVGSMLGSNTLLAISTFVTQGYIVAIPDYIGQGVDFQNVHPYVIYPKATAKTAIDMLGAVKKTLTNRYGYSETDQIKLFSVGYSEGGAYSLWFNSYINETPQALDPLYKLTHSVGAEGAYNTSDVIKGFLFDNVSKLPNVYNIQNLWLTNGVKPALFADALLSFATYSLSSDYSIFNSGFYSLTCGDSPSDKQDKCEFNGVKYNLSEAFRFKSTVPAQQVLNSAFGKSMGNYKFLANEIMTFISHHNSVYSLLSSSDAGDPSTVIGGKLQAALVAADVNLSGVPNNSVSIITLDQDSVVSPNNFDWLLSKYPTKINTAIKIPSASIQVVSPLSKKNAPPKYMPTDHIEGNVYQFLYALKIFNQFAAAP